MEIPYAHRGQNHYVAVVRCPAICGLRYLHLSQDAQDAWVLRDFIAGQLLRRVPAGQSGGTALMLADIEREIDHAEAPPYLNIKEHANDWSVYLSLRTMTHARKVESVPASTSFGRWEPF